MRGVDQLVTRGRRRGQDTEPGERVLPLIHPQYTGWHVLSGNAPETVATSCEVRLQGVGLACLAVVDLRSGRVGFVHMQRFGFEQELTAGFEAGGDQVLDDLLLAVHGDRSATGQFGERDAVSLTFEAQLDAVMHQPLALHAPTHAHGTQQVDGSLFEDASAHPLLDIVA